MCGCKSGSCGSGCGCGCNCQCSDCSCNKQSSCGCEKSGCGSSCGSSGNCCDKAKKFLELADQAWKEVLKEKIKKHIEANDKNLDELAKLISDTNHKRWKKK